MLLSLPWPGLAGTANDDARGVAERGPSDRPGSERLVSRSDGSVVDVWTERVVERVPLTDEVLMRARVFARAGHDALQPVLRVDREAGCLWLAACGPSLSRPMTALERERLQGALEALRAAGAPAALIDEARAGMGPGGEVVVLFAAAT
jgi:serine/threonine-protein kinase